jgi:hypothetical protein
VLGAEGLLVAGQRAPRQCEALGGAPAGDQREGQLATLAVRLRMVVAKAARRALQQILARQDRLRPFVLAVQRGLERLPVDDPQRDQVLADPSAEPFLARQGNLDVLFASQAL